MTTKVIPEVEPKPCSCRVENGCAIFDPSCRFHEGIFFHAFARKAENTGNAVMQGKSYGRSSNE